MKLSHVLLLSASLFSFHAHAMEVIDEDRPKEHLCPITLQVMADPVVAADGHSYERSAISEYLNGKNNQRSPLTGAPLNNKDLFENHALRTMIMEWEPGKHTKSSVLETRSAESIAQGIKEEFSKNAVLLNAAKDKHIVAFLGNTGAGKSTLVNLLSGKKLIVSSDREDYVLVDPDDKTAMVIGAGGDSETLYPKFIDVDGLRFFDLPGFNDTDGSERNLVNAAFIRKILLDAASVRLVLVVGQDQFTADRSTSVREMFNKLQQLFVIGQGGGVIDNSSVFVATKVTCPLNTEITEFLVKKTNSSDKDGLRNQLKFWRLKDRLACMFHPLREENNKDVRENILKLIKDTQTAEVRGINVSVLYPSDTQHDLERMFSQVFESAFDRKVKSPLTTLSDYDGAITYYTSQDFWKTFGADVCREEDSIGLLKEFCINPYKTAFRNFEKENAEKLKKHVQHLERLFVGIFEKELKKRWKDPLVTLTEYNQAITYYNSKDFWSKFSENVYQKDSTKGQLEKVCSIPYGKALTILEEENEGALYEHIEYLKEKKEERVKDIAIRTKVRVKEVISSIVPKSDNDDFVFFDFAYHKDFYDQVCGPISIIKLTTDLSEQEVVRRYYADFISQHSHKQMMGWHQKFSGTEELTSKISIMEERLETLGSERAQEIQRLQAAEREQRSEALKEVEERRRIEAQEIQRVQTLRKAEEEKRLQQQRIQVAKAEEEQWKKRWHCNWCGKSVPGDKHTPPSVLASDCSFKRIPAPYGYGGYGSGKIGHHAWVFQRPEKDKDA